MEVSMTATTINYFSVVVPNKAGEAGKVLGALKEAGVNLTGFWGYPIKGKKAVLDVAPEDAKTFQKVVKKLGLEASSKKQAIFAAGDDAAGALLEVTSKITAAGINIHAAQAISSGSGQYGAFIQVDEADFKKAKKAAGAK
jgi:hypothetical protein